MPLTGLRIEINQKRPGWGQDALHLAAAALRAEGCAAMAAELDARGETGDADELLALLARYVRLDLLPGEAPPGLPATMFRGGFERSGRYPGEIPIRPRVAWTRRLGSDADTTPAVCGRRVLVGNDDGNLFCLDLRNGEEFWRYRSGGTLRSSAATDGRRVVACDEHGKDGDLLCLDLRNGALLWSQTLGIAFTHSPALVAGRVLAGSRDGHLYCLDLASGRLIWAADCRAPLVSAVACDGKCVVAATLAGEALGVDLETGRVLWSLSHAGEEYAAAPAIDGERVVLLGVNGSARCLAVETGRELWGKQMGRNRLLSSPGISQGVVVIGGSDHTLYGCSLESGKPLWALPTTGWISSSPAICGERVVCGCFDKIVRAFSLLTGERLWSYTADMPILGSAAVSPCGRVLFGSKGGTLHCLEEDD